MAEQSVFADRKVRWPQLGVAVMVTLAGLIAVPAVSSATVGTDRVDYVGQVAAGWGFCSALSARLETPDGGRTFQGDGFGTLRVAGWPDCTGVTVTTPPGGLVISGVRLFKYVGDVWLLVFATPAVYAGTYDGYVSDWWSTPNRWGPGCFVFEQSVVANNLGPVVPGDLGWGAWAGGEMCV